jgi:hypothetical protein
MNLPVISGENTHNMNKLICNTTAILIHCILNEPPNMTRPLAETSLKQLTCVTRRHCTTDH